MKQLIPTFIFYKVLCNTFINYGANNCFFLLFSFIISVGAASLLALVPFVLKEHTFRFTLSDEVAGILYYIIRCDYQKEKQANGFILMTKPPKVHSKTLNEMREEMRRLLSGF